MFVVGFKSGYDFPTKLTQTRQDEVNIQEKQGKYCILKAVGIK